MSLKVIFFTLMICHIYSTTATSLHRCGRHARLVNSNRYNCFPTCECSNPSCPPAPLLFREKVCECRHGYVFLSTTDKRCVKYSECPRYPEICRGKNIVWNECGSHCPPTCQNRRPGPCKLSCNPGCFCKPGYLLNTVTNECVKEEQCPC
ncbi:hypothetical protein WA026_017940 [Henosepilachna vigintioctopunctata]|uniref:TIL domain-containing protein n=1 Tax=Henosepilachna vigintioctopunctata TaxID=420089 RepID=A0AAW1TM09_9CUCU